MVCQRCHGNFLSTPWFLHSIELPGLGCRVAYLNSPTETNYQAHSRTKTCQLPYWTSFCQGKRSTRLQGGFKLKGYPECSCLAINSTISSEVIPRLLICFRPSPSLVPWHVLAAGPERPIKRFIGLIAPDSVQQPSHPQTPLLWTTVSGGCELPNLQWRERFDHPSLLLFEKVFRSTQE